MPSAGRSGGAARALGVVVAWTAVGSTLLWLRFNASPPATGALFPHDLLYYFLPQMAEVGARLAHGALPLWSPYACGGLPLLAALQPAVLYPGTWLAAFVAPARALSILAALHLFVGATGAALFFRALGVAPALAGAFGVVFGFACVIGQTFWPPEVATIAWVPWSFWCAERVLRGARPDAFWVGLAATVALELLAGFPQFAAYGLQLLAAFAVLRTIQRSRAGDARGGVRALGRVAAAVAFGLGVAAVQLGPSFELLADSGRTARPTEAEVHYLNPTPRAARVLANAVAPEPRLTSYELDRGAGYLGVGTLVLAAVALVGRRRDPLVLALFAGAVGFVALADGYVGAASGLYRLYALVPGVGAFRAPERLLFPAFACAIALAALGADACDRASRDRARPLGGAALAAGLAIAAFGTVAAAWRAAVAVGWVAGALWLPRDERVRAAWRALAAVLLTADVVAATGAFGSLRGLPVGLAERMRAGPRAMLSDAELASLRSRAGLARVEFVSAGQRVRPVTGVGPAAGTYRLACYEPFVPGGWGALRARIGGDYRSTVMSNVAPERAPSIYDAASVVAIVRADGEGATRVETNGDALPRAYLVDRFDVVADAAALDALVAGTYDVRRGAMVDADPGFAPRGALDAPLPQTIASYAPERVVVDVDAPHPALLVLTDTKAPGWRATVGGAAAPILRANGLFRAVAVPAGRHRVEFEYAPAGLRVGAAVSAACALGAIGVWLGARRRRARC